MRPTLRGAALTTPALAAVAEPTSAAARDSDANLGAGGGLTLLEDTDFGIAGPAGRDDADDAGFALSGPVGYDSGTIWQLGAGVGYALAGNAAISLDDRYFRTSAAVTTSAATGARNSDVDLGSRSILVGLRDRF
jgi:opacity protein-like surface antigen